MGVPQHPMVCHRFPSRTAIGWGYTSFSAIPQKHIVGICWLYPANITLSSPWYSSAINRSAWHTRPCVSHELTWFPLRGGTGHWDSQSIKGIYVRQGIVSIWSSLNMKSSKETVGITCISSTPLVLLWQKAFSIQQILRHRQYSYYVNHRQPISQLATNFQSMQWRSYLLRFWIFCNNN